MSRKTLLTITSFIAITIGLVVLTMPTIFLTTVKAAEPSETANVMARTAGVLLVAVGTLNFLVRGHEEGPTMRAVLVFNLLLQLAILPIDPIAFFSGVYQTPGSFVPNSIVHVLLASGFAYHLVAMQRRARVLASTA